MEITKEFSPVAGEPPAIDLDTMRVNPLLFVGAILFATSFVIWTVIGLIPNVAPQLLPQRLAGLGYAQEVQGRVDSALVAQEGSQSIVAIIGFSGGQEGIDTEQLAREDNRDNRYLGLCGACDGTISGLSNLSAPLFESELDVDKIIIAINPFHLVVRPFTPSLKRSDIKHSIDTRLLAGRRQVLRLFQRETDPRYRADDPWRPMTKNHFGVVSPKMIQARREQYQLRGYGNIENYDADGRQGMELRSLIRKAHERNWQPIVVLMPVHPELFQDLPASATDKLTAAIDAQNVRVLDYQQAINGTGFYDISHMNEDGRETFTSILSKELFGPRR